MRSLHDQNLWVLLLAEVEEGGAEEKSSQHKLSAFLLWRSELNFSDSNNYFRYSFHNLF